MNNNYNKSTQQNFLNITDKRIYALRGMLMKGDKSSLQLVQLNYTIPEIQLAIKLNKEYFMKKGRTSQ